jgi:hypothetical protein
MMDGSEVRNLRRTKAFLLFIALAATVSFGYCQSFGLKLSGGLSYAGGGDLAKGIKGETEYLGADYSLTGEFRTPYLGMDVEGELIYYFGSKLGIGLGVGYSRHARESTVSYSIELVGVERTLRPKFRVVPITANLHYLLALSPNLRLDLTAGAGYYLATLDWADRMDMKIMGYTGNFEYNFKSTKGTVGFQAGLGLEMRITSRAALVWAVRGCYASISELKGNWTDKGGGELWSYEDSGSGGYAWYYDLKYGGKTYAQVIFDTDKPVGSNFSDVRYAKLSLTGLVTTFGLKIGF